MGLFNRDSFLAQINSDQEFQLESRYLNLKLRLEMGDDTFIVKVKEGAVDIFVPSGPNHMTLMHDYDLEISASNEEWTKFLATNPKPFYQDLFSAVIKHDFRWGGNVKMWFANYASLRRFFDVMRAHTLEMEAVR